MSDSFETELTNLINRHSKESGSLTPDFILAKYLLDCLTAFEKATLSRGSWFGQKMLEGSVTLKTDPTLKEGEWRLEGSKAPLKEPNGQ